MPFSWFLCSLLVKKKKKSHLLFPVEVGQGARMALFARDATPALAQGGVHGCWPADLLEDGTKGD